VKHFYPNKLSVKHTLKNTCSLLAYIDSILKKLSIPQMVLL